ncbi:acetylxylan esterase [Bacteroides sp.]|uniref:acetylxylan esterase n=1 Tax=Bacteroides sp. TaxID=29523 RepID=UPI001B57B0B4|nr:acetylxylan esterase [Bacteroides sp.]MBP6065620.1 acetylxylan esterase [Bacteroides sp.]MBP6066613.1 acetylxylan esterase [Bacteroides sp.]MBP6937007.1 acetylxylan esterase [Bacteroides sp.]MBP8621586.1 acetylxylan esterase [Bacteroides sp.]MBP9506705.1 acetylxylan esterase [Bacteroides sp.]
MNRKKIILSVCLLLTVLCATAENYPYRSDVLWVTVPNHADWLYKTGEQATVEVQFYKYGIPQDGVIVSYAIGGDMMVSADTNGAVKLNKGKAVIPIGTMKQPGFRDCRLKATVDGKTYTHHVKVGFSPEQLRPYTAMPTDFLDFWEKAKAEQAEFPLKYTRQYVEQYSTDKVDCYLVKLELNKRGQCIYGYLSYPKAKGKYPVVLCPPGAGIKTIKEPLRRKYYPEEGFIRFEIEIHGLNPEMSSEAFREISAAFNGRENGYLTNGLDSRDNYYMKRVYLACVRSIDLLTSLPEWDGKNVIVQGGSQGGALALVTAGLDKRVTACVANHPALSDMAGYKAGRAGGYPHLYRQSVDMDTPEKLRTLSYYDVVNFAKQIKADTYLTWGFNDDVCPPTTSYIVYNVLNCPKEALITPINEHWTSEDTEYGHLLWMKKQLK